MVTESSRYIRNLNKVSIWLNSTKDKQLWMVTQSWGHVLAKVAYYPIVKSSHYNVLKQWLKNFGSGSYAWNWNAFYGLLLKIAYWPRKTFNIVVRRGVIFVLYASLKMNLFFMFLLHVFTIYNFGNMHVGL